MELKAFTILLHFLTLQIHRNFCINLKHINLDNSRIQSIEHITMNPTDSEYKEYYSDYIEDDWESEDYDHVGDINDFQIVSILTISSSLAWYVRLLDATLKPLGARVPGVKFYPLGAGSRAQILFHYWKWKVCISIYTAYYTHFHFTSTGRGEGSKRVKKLTLLN